MEPAGEARPYVTDTSRMLHDAPLPPWPGRSLDEIASRLDGECEWLVTNDVLPADVVTRNRRVAEAALRPVRPGLRDRPVSGSVGFPSHR
jgi:hypothetical protein